MPRQSVSATVTLNTFTVFWGGVGGELYFRLEKHIGYATQARIQDFEKGGAHTIDKPRKGMEVLPQENLNIDALRCDFQVSGEQIFNIP